MNVRSILSEKGHKVYSVPPSTTVYEALVLMRDKNIGSLLVMESDKLIGLISERDYARKVILEGKFSKDIPVSDVMTRDVIYITPDKTAHECMSLMTYKFLRHLPVLDEGRVIGIISIGDVVKSIIDEQEVEIEHLVSYISGAS